MPEFPYCLRLSFPDRQGREGASVPPFRPGRRAHADNRSGVDALIGLGSSVGLGPEVGGGRAGGEVAAKHGNHEGAEDERGAASGG